MVRHIHDYITSKKPGSSSASRADKRLHGNHIDLSDADKIAQPGHIGQASIYDIVKQIERTFPGLLDLNGSSAASVRSIAASSSSEGHLRGGSGGGLVALGVRMRQWAAALSGTTDLKRFVREMLDDTHGFIQQRQEVVADELLSWRDDRVAEWERGLPEAGGLSTGPAASGVG